LAYSQRLLPLLSPLFPYTTLFRSVRMRMLPHRLKHRNSLFGHTQGGLPQSSGRILVVFVFRLVHMTRMPASFESVKESSGSPRRGDRRRIWQRSSIRAGG